MIRHCHSKNRFLVLALLALCWSLHIQSASALENLAEESKKLSEEAQKDYTTRPLEGWTVHVHKKLLSARKSKTERAIELLGNQLRTIREVVPASVVTKLQKVNLWISPEYEGHRPAAEYHPNRSWLIEQGRLPELERCVEFSNVEIFERECVRMPMLALHELAHAYHDQVLGFDHSEIRDAFAAAKQDGKYDSVERWFGPDRENTHEKAYAMTNPKEYFAECSEAFFGRNDFYPFTREQLTRHDPEFAQLLAHLWQVPN